MYKRLARAYKTAWRWPEVIHESKTVIYLSRALTIGLPILCIASTIASGIIHSTILWPIFFCLVIIGAFVASTVLIFQDEYTIVEEYEKIEKRIANQFCGFPQYTKLPMYQDSEGEWFAYGHIPPHKFVSEICKIVYGVSEDETMSDKYLEREDEVIHTYASYEDDYGETLRLCIREDEGAFPITKLYI